MQEGQWSRSRYWLCYFIQSRHERVTLAWQEQGKLSERFYAPLAQALQSLARRRCARPGRIAALATACYAHDPAFLQALRLYCKERQYHQDLLEKLLQRYQAGLPAQRLAVTAALATDSQPVVPIVAPARRVAGQPPLVLAYFRLRQDLTEQLLQIRIDSQLWQLIRQLSAGDPLLTAAANQILRDLAAHNTFLAERLIVEFAQVNLLRRNLRRLRLRLLFVPLLLQATAGYGPLLCAIGVSPARFAWRSSRSFQRLLERIVPYRREVLLQALLRQREQPYERFTAVANELLTP